jgi:protoheme IX farnesyltransferase
MQSQGDPVKSVALANQTSRSRRALTILGDYLELIKPRISVMVLLTVIVAGYLATGGTASVISLIHVAIGVGLIAASGSAWNQYLERYTDFLMPRTADRPLPKRRLTAQQVTTFGAITFGAGMAYLGGVVGVFSMLLGLATFVLYVVIYTPMKRLSWWNTAVGAIAGAMPILIGAAGAGGSLNGVAWGLFAILFLWQFPHFMAIAWLYRRDYADGGLRMITVVDPTGRLAGWHATIGSLAVLLTSAAMAAFYQSATARWVVLAVGLVAGAWYLVASIRFAWRLDSAAARRLLRVSLVHLPLVLLSLVVAQLIDK